MAAGLLVRHALSRAALARRDGSGLRPWRHDVAGSSRAPAPIARTRVGVDRLVRRPSLLQPLWRSTTVESATGTQVASPAWLRDFGRIRRANLDDLFVSQLHEVS